MEVWKIFRFPIIVVDGGLSVNQLECLGGTVCVFAWFNLSNIHIFSKKDQLRYHK